jgi:hypothetical protein
MSMTQSIRDALAGGKLTFKKLHETVGGDDIKLKALLSNLKQRGIIKIAKDDERTITLRKSAPPQGGRKKPAGRKKAVRKSPARRAGTPGPAEQFRQILVDNIIGAGKLLRQAVEDQVEIDPTNFALRNAMDNHARAEQLYAAGQS